MAKNDFKADIERLDLSRSVLADRLGISLSVFNFNLSHPERFAMDQARLLREIIDEAELAAAAIADAAASSESPFWDR